MSDRPTFEHKAFYSPNEVAAILGVSRSYASARVADGRIQAVRLSPRARRVPYAEVMRLVDQPLPVRRRAMSVDAIEAVSRDLAAEA
jgi:excisionase family DNA binding protein